jgi:permuted papain-like amidase YaeF/Yiix C92 family enzyme
MGDRFFGFLGRRLVDYLEAPTPGYEPFTASDPKALNHTLQPGDVLLAEGNSRIAAVIKYLTQSTWSHSALYVGDRLNKKSDGEPHVLIEANLGDGVISAPLSKYSTLHTRVCRPVGLSPRDRERVVRYATDRIGYEYDVKNITDLIRYLIPLPVPARFRRRMIALGSGLPTKAICSTLIAQAFESVRYPILPKIELILSRSMRREILHIRHHSLYTPRDFDISPYFAIVKPTIELGFNYKKLRWANVPRPTHEPAALPHPAANGHDSPLAPKLPASNGHAPARGLSQPLDLGRSKIPFPANGRDR